MISLVRLVAVAEFPIDRGLGAECRTNLWGDVDRYKQDCAGQYKDRLTPSGDPVDGGRRLGLRV